MRLDGDVMKMVLTDNYSSMASNSISHGHGWKAVFRRVSEDDIARKQIWK
jgi:hypothetical protein